MKELLIYALQVLACNALFAAAYRWLLDGRTGYRFSRLYLIGAICAAAVIPALKIPVWKGEVVYLPQFAFEDLPAIPPAPTAPQPTSPDTPALTLLLILYGAGVLFSLTAATIQIVRILRLRHISQRQGHKGYEIVRSSEIETAFSFFGTIYLPAATPDADLPAIIAHELGHIRHRHSVERVVMELLKALLWWNPFVRIAARQLTEVEEYEADREALTGGCDPVHYTETILHGLFGYTPDIANGLRDSLTKKRLLMICKPSDNRHAPWRMAATLPLLGGLLACFSFTTRAAEIRIGNPDADTTITTVATDSPHPTAPEANPIVQKADPAPSVPPSPTTPSATTNDDDKPHLITEQMPRFPEGDFRNWLTSRLAESQTVKDLALKGSVIVSFVVECDGTVGNIQILDTPDERVNPIVEQTLSASPRWEPGLQDGKPVRVSFITTVVFAAPHSTHSTSIEINPNQQSRITISTTGNGATTTSSIPLSKALTDATDQQILVFVDGKEISRGELAKIESSDIKSITVIKDSTQLAQYGEHAQDGIIKIYLHTTDKRHRK